MRTEKEIIKDFEKLGYKTRFCDIDFWDLFKRFSNQFKHIVIDRKLKLVGCSMLVGNKREPHLFKIEELKLINELFEIWGWIE